MLKLLFIVLGFNKLLMKSFEIVTQFLEVSLPGILNVISKSFSV